MAFVLAWLSTRTRNILSRFVVPLTALLLAGCATMSNTPAQELSLDAFHACESHKLERLILKKVNPDGGMGVVYDPDAPAEGRIFVDCIRPYFAARALEGIVKPGPDAPAAQRQGYANLDECLQRAVFVGTHRGQENGVFVRSPGIRVTALNDDGSFRWDGDAAGGHRLTACMREKAAGNPQQASEGSPAPSATAGSLDGVYAGDVCLGPSPNGDPARCFRTKATVRDGRTVGGWPARQGVTVKLAGEVSTIGDVKIEWQAERPDGSLFSRANLSGTIRNGHLDANGAFSIGRTVSFSWTLKGPASDSP